MDTLESILKREKKMKKGFTIVELMIVVGILSILMTIVTFAASGAIKSARETKGEAIRVALENAIQMYHTQKGKWPAAIESAADSNTSSGSTMELTGEEADPVFREIVKMSVEDSGGSQLVEPSVLVVARKGAKACNDNHTDKSKSDYCGNRNCSYGMDFDTAYRGGDHNQPMGIDEMCFGYAGKEEGRFRRFTIVYNYDTDKVSVKK